MGSNRFKNEAFLIFWGGNFNYFRNGKKISKFPFYNFLQGVTVACFCKQQTVLGRVSIDILIFSSSFSFSHFTIEFLIFSLSFSYSQIFSTTWPFLQIYLYAPYSNLSKNTGSKLKIQVCTPEGPCKYRVAKKRIDYINCNKSTYNNQIATKISHSLRDIISFDLRPHTCR